MNAKGHLSNEYDKNINTKAKAKKYFGGINFTLISVSTVSFGVRYPADFQADTMLGANLSVRFFFGGARFRN